MPLSHLSDDIKKKFGSIVAKNYVMDKQSLIVDRCLQMIPAPTVKNSSDNDQPVVWGVFFEYAKAGKKLN